MFYKLDKTYFSSEFGTYQFYESWVVPLAITGTIANTKTNQYQANFTFTNDNARGRVSIENAATGYKTPFGIGNRLARNSGAGLIVYQATSTEVVTTDVHYESGGDQLTINFNITNLTGGTITLVDQTLNIHLDFYDAPV